MGLPQLSRLSSLKRLSAQLATRSATDIMLVVHFLTLHTLQDVLRLLTLWYRYGAFDDVRAELERGFKTVPVDTWLVAIPQLMARIHVQDDFIVQPLKDLLVKIGRIHPEALMHPLLVCTFGIKKQGNIHPPSFACSTACK